MNPFKEGGNDGGATSSSNDPPRRYDITTLITEKLNSFSFFYENSIIFAYENHSKFEFQKYIYIYMSPNTHQCLTEYMNINTVVQYTSYT